MAAAVADILLDPSRRTRYGAASRSRVARFTVDAMVDRTLAAYAGECPDEVADVLSEYETVPS
jgi:glycosyltransferase involved in cell wall biosynthesis